MAYGNAFAHLENKYGKTTLHHYIGQVFDVQTRIVWCVWEQTDEVSDFLRMESSMTKHSYFEYDSSHQFRKKVLKAAQEDLYISI